MTEQEDPYSNKHQCLGNEQNSLSHIKSEICSSPFIFFFYFFAYLLYSSLLSPSFFSFPCSIPFMWSEAAGLLCFPESWLRSYWRLEGREWQGSGRQWNSKVESFLLFESFWEMQAIGVCISGCSLPLKFAFTQGNRVWLKTLQRKWSHFLLLFFGLRLSWMKSEPLRSSWSAEKLQHEIPDLKIKTQQGKRYFKKAQAMRSFTGVEMHPKPGILNSPFPYQWHH